MVRAVLFDLDDTLFDHSQCARAALAGVRASHPSLAAVEEPALQAAHAEILETLHLDVLAGRLDLDAARIERFRRLYASAGHAADDDLASRTAAMYRTRYIDSRRAVDGAAALLKAVRRRARSVIVSNNLLEEQRAKLHQCGLLSLVDVLVVSEEVGVSKPDARIFEVALERAGCSAAEAVMVGDSWTNDVEGARAAGIRPIWFNRDGAEPPDAAVPVLRALEPIEEVAALLLGLRTSGD